MTNLLYRWLPANWSVSLKDQWIIFLNFTWKPCSCFIWLKEWIHAHTTYMVLSVLPLRLQLFYPTVESIKDYKEYHPLKYSSIHLKMYTKLNMSNTWSKRKINYLVPAFWSSNMYALFHYIWRKQYMSNKN